MRLNIIVFSLLCFSFSIYAQTLNDAKTFFKRFENVVNIDFREAEIVALKTVDLCNDLEDYKCIFRSYSNMVKVYMLTRDYDKANFYIKKALAIERYNVGVVDKIDLYNSIAYLEGMNLNNNKSMEFSKNAIELALKIGDSLRLSESLVNSAGLYIDQQELHEAKQKLKKAEQIAKNNFYHNTLVDVYLSLAETSYYKSKDSTLFYYQIAQKNAQKANNKFKEAVIYSNLGFFKVYNSELKGVEELLRKSLILSKEVGCNVTLHNNYYTLGYYYELLGNYNKSIENYKIAILEYGNYVNPIQLSNAYIMLSSALWHNKNYEEAYSYQEKYIVLNDSIFNLQKSKEFNNIRTKYDVEKKDAEIALLEKEKLIEENRKKWFFASAIFLFLSLLGIFLFFRHKTKAQQIILLQEKELHNKDKLRLQKERELNEIKAYVNGQEKERNRLAKELHDGIGGRLASINLSLSYVNAQLNNNDIANINNNLIKSFNDLRELSHNLSVNAIRGKSLESLLVDLQQQYQKNNIFRVKISIFPDDALKFINENIVHNLYRVLQELLTNILKHAHASEVDISFNLHEKFLMIIVDDDGVGFDVEKNKQGIGIKNIKERIAIVGGVINIDSHKNKGTQVVMEIPIKI